MAKVKETQHPMVLKLNLDLEDLKPKYDRILPEIFQALEHVKDRDARRQLECLLSDVYSTFLQPEEEEKQNSQQPSQFLDIIKRFIQDSTTTKGKKSFDARRLKGIHVRAISKLDQAKAAQKQVEYLDEYFDGLLATLSQPTVPERNVPKDSANHRSKSYHGKPIQSAPGRPSPSKHSALAILNKSKHCAAIDSSSGQDGEFSSPDRMVLLALSPQGGARQGFNTPSTSSHQVEGRGRALTAIDRKQRLGVGVRNRGEDGPGQRRPISAGRRARNKRNIAQEMDNMKLISDSVSEFQLNLPPRYLTGSPKFTARPKAARDDGSNPCRQAIYSSGEQSAVEACPVGDAAVKIIGKSSLSSCSGTPSRVWGSSQSKSTGQQSQEKRRPTRSQGKQRASSVGQGSSEKADSKISSLVEKVQHFGLSLQERRTRVGALRKSNAILKEQIAEVESTLESFDAYLSSVRNKPCQVPTQTMKREMFAFQEAMVERIFSCIELLSAEMKALRKTDQTKADKVKAFLTRYEDAKKETPEALLTFNNTIDGSAAESPPCTRANIRSAELKQCLRAVVAGIECFHTSCEDIWDETLSRVFSELDALFMSLPSPPTKRWTPDDPCSPTTMSLSSVDVLEEDMASIKNLPEDRSKYGALIIFSLHILERVTSEFNHLMVITRIKDLQIISIDHSIGLAYMSMRQMLLPTVKKTQSRVGGSDSVKKKLWKRNMYDKKQKVCKTGEAKSTPPELAHEESPKKRRNTTNTIDKKLKPRLPEGPDSIYVSTDARGVKNTLRCNRAQHTSNAAADTRLPFLHLEGTRVPMFQASGFSPWPQPAATEGPEHAQKTTGGAARTHRDDGLKPTKPKNNFSKIPSTADQLTSSKPPPTVNTWYNNTFVQEKVVFCDEDSEPMDCMGNTVKDMKNHRPIQYCRFLATPVPPPTSLITEERRRADGQKKAQRKPSRNRRFRITSNDLSAQDRSGPHDYPGNGMKE